MLCRSVLNPSLDCIPFIKNNYQIVIVINICIPEDEEFNVYML